jgi:hypothetical protein
MQNHGPTVTEQATTPTDPRAEGRALRRAVAQLRELADRLDADADTLFRQAAKNGRAA